MEWYQDNENLFRSTLLDFFINDKYNKIIFEGSEKARMLHPEVLTPWYYTVAHCHIGFEISITLKGECAFEHGDKLYHIHENDIVIAEKGILHRERMLSEDISYENVYLLIEDDTVQLSVTKYNEGKKHSWCPAMPLIVLEDDTFIDIIQKEIENKLKSSELFFYAYLKSFYFYLCRNIFTDENTRYFHCDYDSKLINMINLYIQHNITSDVSTKDICSYFKLNESYLCKLYKKNEGLTISTYINNMRIRNAVYFLQNTDQKIFDIAFKVGYKDQYYFSKIFKKIMGLSPLAFRNKLSSDYRMSETANISKI